MISLALLFVIATQTPALQMAPDVALTNMKGEFVSLRDYRGKKVILFNWASW